MKLLMLSTDRKMLQAESSVRDRMVSYASELDELHVIVFTEGKNGEVIRDGSLCIYPTNSSSRLLYGFDAIRIARNLPKTEVVTSQDPFETGIAACLISIFKKASLHIQVHTDFLSPAFIKHSFLNRIRTFIAGFVLLRASRMRVVAPRIRDEIIARYKLKSEISVLPIFVDTVKFFGLRHVQHSKFEKSLLFVGRLEAEKRADIAIRTLMRVRALGVNAGLTIVGDGSLKSRLEEFAKQHQVAEWVDFVGQQDPLPHYAHADMLLVPSAYEGYGLVIIEGLASGVPVLSTDVGIAREAGAIIAPDDGDGFSGVLCSMFAHKELPKGRLKEYPYKNEAEYVSAWVADVAASRNVRRRG